MHAFSQPIRTHCQNCGAELQGPYCHRCGQHDFDVHQSFGHLVLELLESFFHFEGRFFEGTFNLLFRPGVLTKEFNAGKRASQMPPLRLYIFISLIFFLAPNAISPSQEPELAELGLPKKESVATDSTRSTNKLHLDNKSFHANFETGTKWDPILREKLKDPDLIQEHFFSYLPKMLLICVPIFALLTLLFFRTAEMNYLQHLVFSLHLHSFFLLFQLVSSGWTMLADLFSSSASSFISIACMIYIPIYAYLALRNVFGQHRRRTLLRGCLLLTTYSLVLIAGFVATLLVAVFMA